MKPIQRSHLLAAAATLTASSLVSAQLRVVSYNIEADTNGNTAPNPGLSTVLQGIGSESTGGIARPIDILTLQETTSNSQTIAPIVTSLNTLYGAGTYAQSPLQGTEFNGDPTTGNGPNALVYNTKTVQLVSSVGIGPLSGSGELRQEIRYQFRPVGYGASSDFYVYVGHYKASGGSTNEAKRQIEAQNVRDNAATLPAGSRILYTGDFNLTGKTAEAAYATLTATGEGQAIDPLNANTSRAYYTESTTSLSIRFDYQFNTAPTTDSHGFSIISGSYHTFGNNGTTATGTMATSTGNTALPGLANRTAVLQALTTASDHYPVVADYRLPAKLGVSAGTVGAQVITGASVSIPVTVANVAPVAVAAGADGLDYALTASGSLSGGATVTGLQALAAGNTYNVALNTASVGVASGTIAVNSTSQEAGSAAFSQSYSTLVLSHAHPSLGASAQNAATIDFGIRAANSAALGLGTPTASFNIRNLPDLSGLTARLDLDSIVGSGATLALTTNAATFTNLAAGSAQNFTATLNGSGYGSFSATYTFNLSDENLPGAQNTAPLTLTLVGRLAMAGDSNVDGTVNALDFNALATYFGATGRSWNDGDFNGDGLVNTVDFTALAQNFGNSYNPNPAPALGSVVPEPASAALALAMSALGQRQARRKRL